MRKKGLLIVVSGPSGAGKGTICKALLEERPEIWVSVSATTRSPRAGEVDGKNYHFLSREVFEKMIKDNAFLEHAAVYDNLYGTPKKEALQRIDRGEDVLLEIDIQGALQVREQYPEGVYVFILPPSMKELRNRIVGRGSETPESLETRFSSAIDEISYVRRYDYYIVNDEVERATRTLMCILDAEKCKVVEDIEEIISEFKEE